MVSDGENAVSGAFHGGSLTRHDSCKTLKALAKSALKELVSICCFPVRPGFINILSFAP